MAAADMYVTTTGAGTKAGNNWANAMSFLEFDADITNSAEAGDRYFVKEGTYTPNDHIITIKNGTSTAAISTIGVVSATTAEPPTSSDWAIGNNRPVFTGSYVLRFDGAYMIVRGIRLESTHNNHSSIGNYGLVINCFLSSTTTSAYYCLETKTRCNIIDTEITCPNSGGILELSNDNHFIGCYIHDCGGIGIKLGIGSTINHCILDTCTTGIEFINAISIANTTIYNCTTGVNVAAVPGMGVLLNNVFDNCTDGFKANASGNIKPLIYSDYNNWSNNTRDMSWDNGSSEDNSAKGANATANAPSFTNAAGGDFSLGAASALIDAGFSISLGV